MACWKIWMKQRPPFLLQLGCVIRSIKELLFPEPRHGLADHWLQSTICRKLNICNAINMLQYFFKTLYTVIIFIIWMHNYDTMVPHMAKKKKVWANMLNIPWYFVNQNKLKFNSSKNVKLEYLLFEFLFIKTSSIFVKYRRISYIT